ncbi:MAG: rane protein [Chloroflexota bacterium]|nr:rane protein [Chloroflexota bacterium]
MVLGGASLAAAAVFTTWLAVPLGSVPTILFAAVLAAFGAVVFGRWRPEAPILALLFTAALIGSPIVPAGYRYMPTLICIATSVGTLGYCLYRGDRLQIPVRGVAILLVAYAAAAGISTITSTDQRLSLTYFGGIVLSLGIAFIASPTLLKTATARFAFAATAGIIGVVLAMASIALWLLGPVPAFDHSLGIYLVTELRIREVLTGLVIPRASGPYTVPGSQAFNLSIALFSLLAIRRMVGPRTRRALLVGIALIVLAILMTMARTGWLVAIVGALTFAAIVAERAMSGASGMPRRAFVDGAALGAFVVLGLTLGALLTNTIGAEARYDLAKARYGDVAAGTTEEDIVSGVVLPPPPGSSSATPQPPPTAVRGGADSSSRGVIWAASLEAILERPLTGHGPGTNAEALAPFLTGANIYYRGLTSHSTWLRTALEMGVIGLVAMLGIVAATAWTVLRHRSVDGRLLEPSMWALIAATAAIFVGQSLETLLLGGLTYASLYWALAMGMLVARPAAVAGPVTIDGGSGDRFAQVPRRP